jgi:hypothetical protein
MVRRLEGGVHHRAKLDNPKQLVVQTATLLAKKNRVTQDQKITQNRSQDEGAEYA